jgi:hypothetical protein
VIAALLVLPAVLLGIKILLPGEKTPPPEPAGVVTAIPEPAVASAPDITAEAEPQQAKPRAAVPEAPAAAASPPQSNQPPLARLAAASRQRAREQMGSGLSLAETNHPVDARRALTAALVSGALDPADAAFVRDRLGALNRRLVFSPEVVADDPFSRRYVVGPGDQLGGIVRRESLAIDWRFIMRVNRMVSERSLRAGQRSTGWSASARCAPGSASSS